MFQYQHPDELLRQYTAERERRERRLQLLRALRGSTPPFGRAIAQRLVEAFRDLRNRPRPAPRASARMGE